MNNSKTLKVYSDFNLGTLRNNLLKIFNSFEVGVEENSLINYLSLNDIQNNNSHEENYGLFWFSPNSISPSLNKAIRKEDYHREDVLKEFRIFFQVLNSKLDKFSWIAVPSFSFISKKRNYGILDLKKDTGISNLLNEVNQDMINFFSDKDKVFILSQQNWLSSEEAYSPKLWFSAKVPFNQKVFKKASKDIEAIYKSYKGLSKKLLILDLDNTLWGGIVGDDGSENLRLGGHDPIGEAFANFQEEILSLSNMGVILAICSKNTESIAIEAIENHPEMKLRMDDFSSFRINWNDKASNIKSICKELNLGFDSVVFLDDSASERERVKTEIKEILVPDFPSDPRFLPSFLNDLNCFDNFSFTEEDKLRKKSYKNRKDQIELIDSKDQKSIDEWINSLNIEILVEKLNSKNLPRTTQLLNKTNQMNLTTRRLNGDEIQAWADEDSNRLWTFRVNDKFGEFGLTGIASMKVSNETAEIIDFVLSCRVMGKKIENSILSFLIEKARSYGAKTIYAKYKLTKRNHPCKLFLDNSGLMQEKENLFSFDLSRDFKSSKSAKIDLI